jgi:Protein of unknown function (DUF3761)
MSMARAAFSIVAAIALLAVVSTSVSAKRGSAEWVRPDENTLNNHHHYKNSNGNDVHSPARRRDGGLPQGYSVQCQDGTGSFSQHPNAPGTCSHHGGRK